MSLLGQQDFLDRDLYAEVEPLLRQALASAEASLGMEHPTVARHLSNLAHFLQATGQFTAAEALVRRALAIDEVVLGNQHPEVARDLNNLAQLLQAANRLSEAEPLMRQALAIDEVALGNEHPEVARDLNNLAQLLQATNRPSEAEPLMRRALAIDEASLGSEHPNIARDLNNLAQLLQAANRLSEAEPLMRRALAIDEATFGSEHPNVARDLSNLAALLQVMHRLTEAEPLMRRSLAIDEASFGREHPNVARDLDNLADLLQTMNHLSEAEPLMRRALAIDEDALGNKHPNVARGLNQLAQLLQATRRLSEAEPLMHRAVDIFERSLGAEHSNTRIARRNLSFLLAEIAGEHSSTVEPSTRRKIASGLRHRSFPAEPLVGSHDIFLSYNSRDRDAVLQVHEALKRRNLRPWIDIESLAPGRLWQVEAEKGLRSCRAAAIFVGPNGISPWEDLEVRVLLTRVAQEGIPLISVTLPGAPDKPEIPPFLSEFTFVDLRSGITEKAIERLVLAIPKRKRASLSKPAQPGPPPLHNLPYPPLGGLLKGRAEELRNLAESFQEDAPFKAIVQSHALYGLGGIGKTRLAVEYAWQFGSRYTAAFFVRADSPESLATGLAFLARADLLDLPERKAQGEIVHAVLHWLRVNLGWLLILDNVDSKEAEAAVLTVLPRLTGGHVLITSRLRDWPKMVSKQSLDTISLEEARAFLLKRTEGERRPSADDSIQAMHLAEKLDGLPLALEQAGAYIARVRLSFSKYLRLWDEEREGVLTWHDESVMEYPASIAVTWKTSFDRLKPTAATLLRLTAFLAPDPIPEEMFESEEEVVREAIEFMWTETGKEEDRDSIPKALAELESYSLISRQEGTFTVHRVVQEVLQIRIPPEWRKVWIESSLKIVYGYSPFQSDDVRTWPVWNVLLPHTARVVLLADQVGVTDPTSRLMNQLGLYLNTRGLYSEAEPLMRRALAIDETSFGKEHPTVARDLNDLAQLLQSTNRFSEAEPLIRRALAIDETSFGNNHPTVARDLNNLAQLLQSTNRLSEAEPLIRRALAIDETSFGNNHPAVARDLNNLAQLLQSTNRLSEAEPLIRQALTIDETSFGDGHPSVARDLNNLAQLLQSTNRLSEAEPLVRRAAKIFERSLGPDHPHTKIAQSNLALLLERLVDQEFTPPLEKT